MGPGICRYGRIEGRQLTANNGLLSYCSPAAGSQTERPDVGAAERLTGNGKTETKTHGGGKGREEAPP
jgi:hypothetical protein